MKVCRINGSVTVMAGVVLLPALLGVFGGFPDSATRAAACGGRSPSKGPDPAYRVVVAPKAGLPLVLPSPDRSWRITYGFRVPPRPCAPTWNHDDQVFYVWGDLDFDPYGANGAHPLSDYRFNQIVPQVMIGNSLAANDSAYHPRWSRYDHWVMEAQYFWMKDDGTPYAQAGRPVAVKPGEEVTTTIAYDAGSGAITASISTGSDTSTVVLPRPFPNTDPPLFSSWKDFFVRAAASSAGLLGRPVLNVESHHVDERTLCSVLPFRIDSIGMPGVPEDQGRFVVKRSGSHRCTGTKPATLGF